MKDIADINDIKSFVDSFYLLIQKDNLLGPVFASRIDAGDWERHLTRMYDFWNTILFFQGGYKGNPTSKHINLPVQEQHFQRWVELFHSVIDDQFSGPVAEETKIRVQRMAWMFMTKLDLNNLNPKFKPIL